MIRLSLRRCVLLMSLLLVLSACQTVPETDREQLLLTSPDVEIALGERAFRSAMRTRKEITEGEEVEMLRSVGHRLVVAAEPMLAARGFADLDWSFHLVDSDTVNAFVVPSGQVVFFRGILPVLETEAGIAAVMGHEVAHVVARHGGERISQKLLLTSASYGLAAALADNRQEAERVLRAAGIASLFLLELPYSRAHEREADFLGTQLMALAGYDPREAVRVWERMEDAGMELPALLSTHPPSAQRRQALAEHMDYFLALYQQAGEFSSE